MLTRLAQRMRCSKWEKKVAEVVEAHAARSPEESALERWLQGVQASAWFMSAVCYSTMLPQDREYYVHLVVEDVRVMLDFCSGCCEKPFIA